MVDSTIAYTLFLKVGYSNTSTATASNSSAVGECVDASNEASGITCSWLSQQAIAYGVCQLIRLLVSQLSFQGQIMITLRQSPMPL